MNKGLALAAGYDRRQPGLTIDEQPVSPAWLNELLLLRQQPAALNSRPGARSGRLVESGEEMLLRHNTGQPTAAGTGYGDYRIAVNVNRPDASWSI